jgi:uncharacterized OB-fold protein
VEANWLLPDLDDEDAAGFWEQTAREQLVVQGCEDCNQRVWPPRPMCPACRSTRRRWVPVSGRGTVWSFVVPHPPLLPAFAELAPYNVIVVALDEDPTLRMVGNLVASADGEINEIDPHSIEIGEPVRVVYHRIEDVTLPRWTRS